MTAKRTIPDDRAVFEQSPIGIVIDGRDLRIADCNPTVGQHTEAMGQLAAGVAHDFNNLLTVIRMESELLADELEARGGARSSVSEIQSAVERAAGLTRQLLAFSRRLVLRPQLLDVNSTVASATQMLERLIGDDIELVTRLGADLPQILVDSGQLKQVLINLAVNARDAMPDGGRFTVTTSLEVIGDERRHDSIPAGEYVVIAVSDTGGGMDEATTRRVFEPFFTTKAAGHGTGLGLSIVYGIMEQSAGHVAVSSDPGRGATFTLYFLPQPEETEVSPEPGSAGRSHPEPAPAATVLLAEDEGGVREACRRILVREGYTVLVAGDGKEALTVASDYAGRIDVLLTDIVLPTLSGPDLYELLRAGRPELRVLYMSGYSDEEIVRRGLGNVSARLLKKPFAIFSLLSAVSSVLRDQRS